MAETKTKPTGASVDAYLAPKGRERSLDQPSERGWTDEYGELFDPENILLVKVAC